MCTQYVFDKIRHTRNFAAAFFPAEAYAQMQEKTAVNTDPATHTQAEQAIIEEYQKSVDPDLVEYAEGGEKRGNHERQVFSRCRIGAHAK